MSEACACLELRAVQKNSADIQLLFDLLCERKHNISHRSLPEFEEHVQFVMNFPYRAWYFVSRRDVVIGTFYIKSDNSIGINLLDPSMSDIKFVLEYIKSKYKPNAPVKSMVPDYFYLNLPSSASASLTAMKMLGFCEIQRSFKV